MSDTVTLTLSRIDAETVEKIVGQSIIFAGEWATTGPDNAPEASRTHSRLLGIRATIRTALQEVSQ